MIVFLLCVIAAVLLFGRDSVADFLAFATVAAVVGFLGLLTYAVLS